MVKSKKLLYHKFLPMINIRLTIINLLLMKPQLGLTINMTKSVKKLQKIRNLPPKSLNNKKKNSNLSTRIRRGFQVKKCQ